MKSPLRIGIDFDGVIVDHRAHKLRLAGELGFALEGWQTNTNVMGDYLDEEAYRAVQKPLYDELTVQAPPVFGALETLANLPGELYVVSARRPENTISALAWMEKHGFHDIVPPERVIFCPRGRDKNEHCERLGISIFLDDKIKYLGHLNDTIRRVLFDEDGIAGRVAVPSEFEVVTSWREFAVLAAALKMERV
jgi:hypothetical protein